MRQKLGKEKRDTFSIATISAASVTAGDRLGPAAVCCILSSASRPRVLCTSGPALSDLHKNHAAQFTHRRSRATVSGRPAVCVCGLAPEQTHNGMDHQHRVVPAALQHSPRDRPCHYGPGRNLPARVLQLPGARIVISAAVFNHFSPAPPTPPLGYTSDGLTVCPARHLFVAI